MLPKKLLSLSFIWSFCAFSLVAFAQTVNTASYTEDTGSLLNPERGFYKHTDSHDGYPSVFVNSYSPLTSSQLDTYRADGFTLVLRLFYIHEFVNVDTISQSYKQKMQDDFDLLRSKGMKAIIRFAYSNIQDSLDMNVTPERITSHLQSLKTVLAANQDVILVVQAGLIGTWGEWYYTDNFGNAGTITSTDYVKRYQVIAALLENVPQGIQIQLRTPNYKQKYLDYIGESTSAVSASEAYNPALVKARLGHHNDCILSTPDGRTHVLTIPKSTLTSLNDTIAVGYRGIKNNALWANSSQSQLPAAADSLATYVMGTNSPSNWEAVPNVVPFANGTVQAFKVADDTNNLYIYVSEGGYLASGKDRYEIFINTDYNFSTGWIDASAWAYTGADYLIQKPIDQANILYSQSGGNGWSWTQVTNPGLSATLTYFDSFDDQGTFATTGEIDWVADDSKYVMVGGETCLPTNQNDCSKSEARFAYHHYTFLNDLYQPDVISKWETQGCFNDIANGLGYRLRLNAATVQSQVEAGGKLFVSLDVTNLGYAAPSRLRPIYLVLRDTITSSEYSIPFASAESDIRTWLTGNVVVNEMLDVPANIPASSAYKLFVNLPDASSSLSTNSKYSIRLANLNTWESTTGYNALGLGLQIQSASTPSTPSIVVDGSLTDWSSVDVIGIGDAGTVKAYDNTDTLFASVSGSFGNGYNLYIDADGKSYTGYAGWAEGADYKLSADKLYRFEFGESWVEIADSVSYVLNSAAFEVKIPKSLLYGLDETVKLGYENLASGVSSGKAPTSGNLFAYTLDYAVTVTRPTVTITADGSSSDWAYVDALVQKTGTLELLKVFDDKTNVYVLVKGSLTNNTNNYQMFLNTDGDVNTGLVDNGFWSSTGADYAYLGGYFYKHDSTAGTSWGWTAINTLTVQTSSDSSTREIVIPKSYMNQMDPGAFMDVGYRKLSGSTVLDKLPASGGMVRYTIESPYVKNLESLTVSDDLANLTLTVQGGVITDQFLTFIDTDNNASTGYTSGTVSGADYLVENGNLQSYAGTGSNYSWTFIKTIGSTDSPVNSYLSQRVITIGKDDVGLTTEGDTVNVSYANMVSWSPTDYIPASGMQLYLLTKPYVPLLQTFSIDDDGTNIYLTVSGSDVVDSYEAFINSDNNSSTGFTDATWSAMGAEYLVKTEKLYQYNGTGSNWSWTEISSGVIVTNTQVNENVQQKKLTIPRVAVSSLAQNDIITAAYRDLTGINLRAKIPGSGGMKADTLQYNYVQDLQQLVITDDADSVYLTITGGTLASTYDVYINADEIDTTGYYVTAWSPSGADILIQNGTLYTYSGTAHGWGWTYNSAGVAVTDTNLGGGSYQRKIAFPRSVLSNSILSIAAGYSNTSSGNITAQLPAAGGLQNHVLTPLELTIGEVGKLTNDQISSSEWTTVTLTNTYTNPVVIMSPLSYNGNQPATLRVKDVTSTSFKYQIDEWDYLDGVHEAETFFYLVVEAGVYELGGGVTLQAGNVNVNSSWSSVSFIQSFSATPLAFAQTVTYNDSAAVTTRIRYIDSGAFNLKVQEEEGSDGVHATETVAWVALSEGSGNAGRSYEVDGTSRNYDNIFFEKYFNNSYDDPILLANMQTAYGGDPCALRYEDLGSNVAYYKVEEERSADFETRHTNEEIGFMVFDSAGVIKGKAVYQSVARVAQEVTPVQEKLVDDATHEINVYPNPTTDYIKLSQYLDQEQSVKLIIYGMDGKQYVQHDWQLVEGDNELQLDVNQLPRGMYLLKVISDEGVIHKKIIKN